MSDDQETTGPNGERWVDAAPLIAELGVQLYLAPDDRLTDVLIIGRGTELDTGNPFLTRGTNGLDWITEGGLVRAYEKQDNAEREIQFRRPS